MKIDAVVCDYRNLIDKYFKQCKADDVFSSAEINQYLKSHGLNVSINSVSQYLKRTYRGILYRGINYYGKSEALDALASKLGVKK